MGVAEPNSISVQRWGGPWEAAEQRMGQQMADGDDAGLIARACGNPDGFAEIYLRHYQAVAGLIYRRTGDQHVTDDLTADVFLAAYRALPRYRVGGTPLRAWLLRIASNRVNRWVRRGRGMIDILARLARLRPVSEMPREVREYPVALRALLSLAPEYQTVMSLHHLEGLGIEEAALVLECPIGTVKSRLNRARAGMRRALGEMGELS
ncbi:MAG: RNA polymerase sigma factor [Phycisphaerales bacterium]|nr:RNA polymerase sigma factor [Phycisphaerales bacterium]